MRILIDTQVFIWLINADQRIGANTYELLNNNSNEISLSYFSLFEMKIKATIGKLTYDDSLVDDLSKMGIASPTTTIRIFLITYLSQRRVQKSAYLSPVTRRFLGYQSKVCGFIMLKNRRAVVAKLVR